MRRLGLAIGFTVLSAWPAVAQDKPPVVARAEQCLREKVDRVVAVEPDVNAAANFLVTFACAPQVSAATRYEFNLVIAKAWVGMANNMPQISVPGQPAKPPETITATVDPETGEIVIPPPPTGTTANPMSAMLRNIGPSASMSDFSGVQIISTPLRKLAGDLVLQARERQLAKPH
jgi:hypothetical protein